jgi:L-ornithine N5-monooxygenase
MRSSSPPATGLPTLLGATDDHCERLPSGALRIERDYRIATSTRVPCGIYVQGATEPTHGLASTLLSNTAVKAGEIVDAVADRLSVSRRSAYAFSR